MSNREDDEEELRRIAEGIRAMFIRDMMMFPMPEISQSDAASYRTMMDQAYRSDRRVLLDSADWTPIGISRQTELLLWTRVERDLDAAFLDTIAIKAPKAPEPVVWSYR
jgi:microcystin degradation protein MlrC